jgi:ribosomal protein S18 acetylase RimI-like enzyme
MFMDVRIKDEIRIRNARHDELEALGALVQASYAEFEPGYPPESWQRYYTMLGEVAAHFERSEIIVAERVPSPAGHSATDRASAPGAGDSPALVGTVTFYPDGSLSGQGEWPHGWAGVLRLGVLPGYRGLGLGRALVDECVRRCHQRGIETLALHTTEWMAVARGMYERMGFQRDPAFDFIPRSGVYAFGYKLRLD